MRQLRALMAAGALAATVASCQATLPNPCGLLTVEEVENEVGTQFAPPDGGEYLDSGGLLCVWVPEQSRPIVYPVLLSVQPFSSSEWDAIEAIAGARSVAGLGEEAYFVPGPGEETYFDPFGAGIHVRQRGIHLTLLHLSTGGESVMQRVVVELARLATTRLSLEVTPPPEAPPGF